MKLILCEDAIMIMIKQIGLILFCCGVMLFSGGFGLVSSAIAAPSPLAAMEEMADEATNKTQETAEETKNAVKDSAEGVSETVKDAKETVENKAKEGIEKTKEAADKAASEAKENGEGIVDKVKGLFSGD